jgi:hypothetical protein
MAGSKIGLKLGPGWKKFKKAIDPKELDKAMKRRMVQANKRIGKMAEAKMRKVISKGGFAPNAALTIAIKKSTLPLVDKGHTLFQAITSVAVDDHRVFVGVLKTDDVYNIAFALHEGANIQVTRKMRAMFYYLWQASEGKIAPSALTGSAAELWERNKTWMPLKASTRVIVIPSRPFIKKTFEDGVLKRKAQDVWAQAVKNAIKDRSKAVGKAI